MKRSITGRRRHSAQVLKASLDTQGNPHSWQPVGLMWVSIAGASGRELEAGGQIIAEASHKMGLPPLGGGVVLTEDHRVTVAGLTYEVLAIIDADGTGRRPVAYVTEVR